jgi:hypothetical protein
MYLSGATVWSCLIAVYRILYIRAQNWVQSHFGDKTFLSILLVCGLAISFVLSCLLAFFDHEGVNIKLCTQLTTEGIDILQTLKVIIFNYSCFS